MSEAEIVYAVHVDGALLNDDDGEIYTDPEQAARSAEAQKLADPEALVTIVLWSDLETVAPAPGE